MGEWTLSDGAIIERPRSVTEYPLLAKIYAQHDALIDRYIVDGVRTLEVAFGSHPHPDADIGIDAFHANTRSATGIDAATADMRDLPFHDDTFSTVIGRRFLHHVPGMDRGQTINEMSRILDSSGRLIFLEGTPGLYRRITKHLAFRFGVLEEDNDEYGHLSPQELQNIVGTHGFEITETRSLGSPLMPLSIITSPGVERLAGLYNHTQWIRWWTLLVAEPRA